MNKKKPEIPPVYKMTDRQLIKFCRDFYRYGSDLSRDEQLIIGVVANRIEELSPQIFSAKKQIRSKTSIFSRA